MTQYENLVSENLLSALILVESNGNAGAVGDNGNAKGCLQIWSIVIQDVNRIYKTNYAHDDAFDKDLAKEICRRYLSYWGKYYVQKINKSITDEVLARIWNGGPSGYHKDETIAYWEKVKLHLQGIKTTIIHDKENLRVSEIFLKIQRVKQEELPIDIICGKDTWTINTIEEAEIIARGMLMTMIMIREVEEV